MNDQKPARSDHEWYALVMLDPVHLTDAPRTFIVPRDHAAAAAWIGHRNWQNEPGVPVGKRNPGMQHARVGTDIVADYEDRWDLLGTPKDKVPIMLPPWYRELAADPRVGLPPEHPWKKRLPKFDAP